MSKRREEFEDDGRTVADMSDVSRPSLWGRRHEPAQRSPAPRQEEGSDFFQPEDKDTIPPEDRVWYVLGTLKAALLIALAFIVGLGLTIALLLLFWHIL